MPRKVVPHGVGAGAPSGNGGPKPRPVPHVDVTVVTTERRHSTVPAYLAVELKGMGATLDQYIQLAAVIAQVMQQGTGVRVAVSQKDILEF